MRTKDVLEALNISRERIKYYKKEKVFAPEKGSVNGRADYTNNDLENLKRLVILSKAGLSCADIRKMQEKAGRPLKEIAETRKESIFKEMERMKASLLLLDELLSANVQYDTTPIEELWEYVQQKEQAGEDFMDAGEESCTISKVRNIRCPHCHKRLCIDLEEFQSGQTSDDYDSGMGEDIVYYFDSEDVYECPKCGTIIQIKGWIREYPLGAYDSEEINVSQWRT